MTETKLTPIIEDSFLQFAGAVLQSRALVDVRDCLKPSARQIFYCMQTDGFVHSKPFQKTLKAIGSSFRLYIHGDSSAEGVIMRAGQPFAMRYPLVEVEGSYGTLLSSGSWSAPRYTASRLSQLSDCLFADIKKDVISEWRDNYDNTEQYPSVLPSKGFYNLVNGTFGLGVGASSSVPQYNLTELHNALIYLIDQPECSFDEIYVAPDFATGATIINANQVKESHRNGTGFACKIRSTVNWDTKERCFVVTEIPFMVYTETICKELEEILESEENPGVERFNDLTGEQPLIKIYLTKKANPDKVLRYLYKNTSLQSYFGINFTMLDQGRFPKVFTWKEMLQAHIDHEAEVYRNGFQFDLRKIAHRVHIIDGLLICLASIEEVVQTIKSSASTAAASLALQKNYLLDEEQAKAVLDMKLSRLAHLEVTKLEKERVDLLTEETRIRHILETPELFNNELKEGWRATIKKYGDARRTKVINLEENNDEPIEVKKLQVSLTNYQNVLTTEASTLYTQKRGGVGTKLKLESGEYVIDSRTVESNEELLFFTQNGNVYHTAANKFIIDDKTSLFTFFGLKDWEHICAFTANNKTAAQKYILFITKQGMIKKTEISEYNTNRNVGLRAIALNEGDEIVSILFVNDEKIGILTEFGNFLIITTDDIRSIGRIAKGIKAIKLNDEDGVVAAHVIPASTKTVASISASGLFKQTSISEFSPQGKNTKGAKLQKLNEGDWMADFLPLNNEKEIVIVSTRSTIKLTTTDIPTLSKGALGNKSIKLNAIDNVIGIITY